MVSVIIVSHGNIGKSMLATTKKIIPECRNITEVAIESDSPPEINRQKIREAIKNAGDSDGVFLLADMFGGTPSNLCLPFMERGKVEVISGFNLPMLIKLANFSGELSFEDLAKYIKSYGQKNVVIASEVLNGKVEYR